MSRILPGEGRRGSAQSKRWANQKSISYTFKKSIAGSVADYSTLNPLSYHPNYDAMKARAPAYSYSGSNSG